MTGGTPDRCGAPGLGTCFAEAGAASAAKKASTTADPRDLHVTEADHDRIRNGVQAPVPRPGR